MNSSVPPNKPTDLQMRKRWSPGVQLVASLFLKRARPLATGRICPLGPPSLGRTSSRPWFLPHLLRGPASSHLIRKAFLATLSQRAGPPPLPRVILPYPAWFFLKILSSDYILTQCFCLLLWQPKLQENKDICQFCPLLLSWHLA